MARRQPAAAPRTQYRTALLVGEGEAELNFLKHLKALYLQRGDKRVTLKNAKGKGGAGVLDYTRRQWQQADFDEVGALLDTDTSWGDPQRKLAVKLKIEVFESTPCLEALVLSVLGEPVPHDTKHCKVAFERALKAPAHTPGLFEKNLTKADLDAAQARVPTLRRLIAFLCR